MSAGHKEVLLASTRLPIFYTFAAFITEFREHFEENWPGYLSLDSEMETLIGSYDPAILEDIRARHEGLRSAFECSARLRLSDAGVSDAQLETPEMQRYISEVVDGDLHCYRLWVTFVFEPRKKARRPFDLSTADFDDNAEPHEHSDFVFDRRIVRETLIGALLGPGHGNNDATIKYLNRGLPNGRRGVDWSHLRTAVEGFVNANKSLLITNSDQAKRRGDLLMQNCLRRVLIADNIWKELRHRYEDAPNPIIKLFWLIDSGEFHSIYRAAEDAVELPEIEPGGHLRIIERQIRVLKDLQEAKLAEEFSG